MPTDRGVTLALAAVLAIGFAVRAQISLVPDFLTGDDGAYYLVQVRAILRSGRLPIPDFPLVFYAQACLAGLLSLFLEQSAAIVAAVRWSDAVMPVLLAVPVYLFVRRFTPEKGSGTGPVLAMVFAGLLATASVSPLWMAGGAIKNGCALPLGLLFAYCLMQSLSEGRARSLWIPLCVLVISSLSHISALALNAALLVLVVVCRLVFLPQRGRAFLPAAAFGGALAGAILVALWLDPDRGWRFLGVLIQPSRFFAGSPVVTWLAGQQGARLEAVASLPGVWIGNALGLLGAYALWRYRAAVDQTTRLILWATTLETLLFASPLLAFDLAERLSAVAFVPGLVPLTFLLCRCPTALVAVVPLTALALLGGMLTIKTARLTSLRKPAYEELVRMKAVMPPGKTILIVRHELNWWVVWVLEVHFSTRVRPALEIADRYDSILLLDEIGPGAFGHRAPFPMVLEPGWGLRDREFLQSRKITTITEGNCFRLSRVETVASGRQ